MTSPLDPGDPQVRPPFWRHRYYYLALKVGVLVAATPPPGAITAMATGDLEIGTTAQRLGITTCALSKLLLHDEQVGRAVNDLRRARQMRPLR